MSSTAGQEQFSIRGGPNYGGVSKILRVIFWVYQVVFGLACAALGPMLLLRGTTVLGFTPAGALSHYAPILSMLFLAWIGGTLLWGFASLLHHPLFSGSEIWSQADG
jgi:hypothetical protein